MNLKKQFLTLSIKHQISIVISLISIFSLLLILALFSLYGNIILSIRSRAREEYFHERYKLIFDSQVDFQNFLLYQYEQLLKQFNEEFYYYSISLNDFNETFFYGKDIPMKIIDYNNDEKQEKTTVEQYYKLNYKKESGTCEKFNFTKNYIFLHNHLKAIQNLRILYLGFDGKNYTILEDYLFASLICKFLFSHSKSRIEDLKNKSNSDFDGFLDYIIKQHYDIIKNFLDGYKTGELTLMDILFPDKIDIFQDYVNLNINEDNITDYIENVSHHFTYLDYLTQNTFSIDNRHHLIQEYKFLSDYFDMIFMRVQNFINLNTIPVFKENNTIYSKDLCFAFLYKQIVLLNITEDCEFNKDRILQIYDRLKVGETNIADCILSDKYDINIDENINIFLKNKEFDNYYSLKSRRDAALFKLSQSSLGQRFLGMKYTFPDYSSIFDFNPSFMTLEQLNLYSFSSFHESTQFIINMKNFYTNCQYLMVLLIFYLWIIIYIFLRIKLKKIYREVIKPINDLNDMISQLDIKEENQLRYEADESINELFKLCNELLLGKYKKKLLHESELEIEKMDKDKNNNFNNLKIDRKIIEEMIENKNRYNNVENDIFLLKTSQEKTKNPKAFTRERRKLNTVLNNPQNNNILNENKELFNLDEENKFPEDRNKKMSANDALLHKKYEELFLNNNDITKMENEENILEMKSAFNYKNLYEIVDLVFNYDMEYGRNFIPRKSKLLYKENIKTYNRLRKGKNRKASSLMNKEEDKSKAETIDKTSAFYEIRDDANVKLEDFDKSVVNAFETKNLLFIWYEEAKYYNNVEFLQQDHDKELKQLCKVILNNNENIKMNQNQNFNNSIKKNNINIKESRIKNKNLRKLTTLNSGIDNQFKKNNLKP